MMLQVDWAGWLAWLQSRSLDLWAWAYAQVWQLIENRPGQFVATIIGTIIAWLLWQLAKEPLTSGWRNLTGRTPKAKPMPAGRFNILIADLAGDTSDARSQSEHIRQSIETQFGADRDATIRVARAFVALNPNGDLDAQRKKGRDLLKRLNGTVLVWGAVASADQALRLRFLSPSEDGGDAAKGFALDAVKELPLDFGSKLAAIVLAEAAVSVQSAYQSGSYVADTLARAVATLEPLIRKPPAALTPDQRGRLFLSYASAQGKIGEQSGQDAPLRSAVNAFRAALQEYTRDRVPLDWAMTQNNLGYALRVLGERGDDKALSDAVTAFRAALQERTRDRVPLDWAMTQNNLGNALRVLGERGDDQALRDAVTAFRAALQERTRDRVPLDWAMTQNNLGNALRVLGERGDDQALRDAVTAFRDALKEYTRDRVPLDWAMTQNNLANALHTQAVRSRSCALLSEASTAIAGALEEFGNGRAPAYEAVAKSIAAKIEATRKDLGCP
jgi:tetratricopeptide (TPR) repeat protein